MFTYFYRPLRFYAQAQCLRAGAVFTIFFLSTGVRVREGHDAPVQAPAPPGRLLLKKQMLLGNTFLHIFIDRFVFMHRHSV